MDENRPRRSGRRLRGDRIAAPARGGTMLGYATVPASAGSRSSELKEQAALIARHCDEYGLTLREVVSERAEPRQKGIRRPGLEYAFSEIRSGEAHGLVVAELSRLSRSAVDLGTIIGWLITADARLIAIGEDLDTDDARGRLAADLLVQVANWERERLSERTRKGLAAARREGRSTGRPSVRDFPGLTRRIAHMRAQGMTLQAIADQLNEEGVPTVRGGAKWRHSSVQAAAGYRRKPNSPGPLTSNDLTATDNP